MKKIAIIGANSFLAIRLRKKMISHTTCEVHVYGRNVELFSDCERAHPFYLPEDTIDYGALLTCDAIVYCAGAGVQSSVWAESNTLFEVNVFEPIRIAEYLTMHAYTGKLITFGSYFEIGCNQDLKAYSEEDVLTSNLNLVNDYTRSKRQLSNYMMRALNPFKKYHLILGSIYGKGELANRIIPYIINEIRTNKPIHISSGDQIRQYIHVDDVCDLILNVFQHDLDSGIYNISSQDSISIKKLCMYICNLLNATSDIQFGALQKTDQQMGVLMLSIDKIIKHTSWKPKVSLEEGITEYLS